MTKKNQVDYNRESQARKREMGFVRVETWVPEKDREAFLKLAQELREKHLG